MPRTFGDSLLHKSHIDYAVEIDEPLVTHGGKPPSEVRYVKSRFIFYTTEM